MKIITRALGPVQANCYLLIQDGHALVIDPGAEFKDLDRLLEVEHANLDAILLTHAHFDHIGGIDSILKNHDVDVYVNPHEVQFLINPDLNGSNTFFTHVVSHAKPRTFKEGLMTIGAFDVEVFFFPGHSIGSTVFKIDDKLFTGDFIFQGSIGRMDLETGSEYAMFQSLKKFMQFDQNYPIYPGHGPSTTLDLERRWNPYLQN